MDMGKMFDDLLKPLDDVDSSSSSSSEIGVDLLSPKEALNVLRKKAGPEAEKKPAIENWDDSGTGGMTGGSQTGGEKDDWLMEEEEEDGNEVIEEENEEEDKRLEFKGQIVGRIGIRGLAPIEWKSKEVHQEVLCESIVNITGIDESQLEFDQNTDDKSAFSSRRLLSYLRFSQFSEGYTITLGKKSKSNERE